MTSDIKTVTKTQARAALKTLDRIERLLDGGKGWVRGEFKAKYRYNDGAPSGLTAVEALRLDQKKIEQGEFYCLVGALRKVDGPAQKLVTSLLYQCLPPGYALPEDATIDSFENRIIDYNDGGTWPKVRNLLAKARRKVEKHA